MSFWIKNMECNCRSTYVVHDDTVELVKTLLLHNEMDVLLRIASHPDVHLAPGRILPYDTRQEWGWAELPRSALMA